MLQRITLIMSPIFVQIWLISIISIAAEEPKAGENFLWIDLGKENKGLLLTQEEQADGITEPATKDGVVCRENPWPYNGPGHNHMYFRIDDGFLVGGKHKAWIVMEYFDSLEAQQIDCQYDSNGAGPVNGAFRGAGDGAFPVLKPEGTEKWRVHIWFINKDGRFENRANGSDFRFSSHGQGPIWINRVWFSLIEPPDPFDPEVPFGIGKAVEPVMKLATTWGNIKR
ncbi:TPA: hypothetical protein EYP66_18585 [Candidatus Poribacteria bacterium]|nr:hypothetical protein [Candidatus Poribacteria bacterium]